MKVKRPNAGIYFVAYILVYPFLKLFFRLKVERDGFEAPKGAHIVLANHNTVADFMLVMFSYYPKRLNAIVAQKYFLIKPLNKLLPTMGCISKSMFDPDVKSIIGIKTVLKRGDGILLFPEGRVSTSGDYVGINKATGKLIKKLGVPVVSCYTEGSYVCIPHWRKRFRRGNIRVTFKTLITEEDAKTLSILEINNAIDARLCGEEGALPVLTPFKTSSKNNLALGLHNILYFCPACKNEYVMKTTGNKIYCTDCGANAVMDCYAKLTFDTLSDADSNDFPDTIQSWYSKQVTHEMCLLYEDMAPIVVNVTLQMPAEAIKNGTKNCGRGVMKLDPKGWQFDGDILGEHTNIHFPIETTPAISYDLNDNFQIYSSGKFYKFLPDEKHKALKYVILTECMHRKFSSIAQMTAGNVKYD